MNRFAYLRLLCIGIALAVSTPLWAGVPVTVVSISSQDDAYNLTSPGVGQSGASKTITLTIASNNGGTGAQLTTIGTTGNTDFQVVPGGTCTTSPAVLANGSTCTILVRYTPATANPETGTLALSCNAVALPIGGFTLQCTGATGNISLFGSILATISAPLLDPRTLTMFAATLLGLGMFFAARRNG